MELRDLRYFPAVASELHFARAAQRLFISQPALSQQIRSLEGELGLKLLERNSRGVQLTAEGKAFLAEAAAVIQQADRALDVARALAEGATGHLRLSHLRTMPRGVPEHIVGEYQRRYPGVEIIPESGSTEQNVDRIRDGHLDLAFVLGPLENTPELSCLDIAKEPIVVAVPSAHALSRRRRAHREDLPGEPLVWFPRHNSPGFYDSCLSQIDGDTAPPIVRTEPNEERMLVAVSQGDGITMLLAARTATLRFQESCIVGSPTPSQLACSHWRTTSRHHCRPAASWIWPRRLVACTALAAWRATRPGKPSNKLGLLLDRCFVLEPRAHRCFN